MLTIAVVHFLLIIALCNGHLSQILGSRWKRSVDNTGTGPVSHTCNDGEVFVIQTLEGKEVILQCSPITICNQLRSASTSTTSGMCVGKANYVHGINQMSPNGDVSTICSQFTPPVPQHVQDNCGSISIINGNLAERSKFNNHPNGPSPGTPSNGNNGPGSPSNNGGIAALLEMMTSSSTPPVVKGLQKIKNEYLVTFCYIQCDQTTTTTSTTKLYTVATAASVQKQVQPSNNNQVNSGGNKAVLGGISGSAGTAGNGASHINSGNSQPGSSETKNSVIGGTHKSGEHKHESQGRSSEKSKNKQLSSGGKERRVQYGRTWSSASSGSSGSSSINQNSQNTGQSSQQGQGHVSISSSSNSNVNNGGSSVSNHGSSNTDVHSNVHHDQTHGDTRGHGGNGGGFGGCFSSEMTVQTKVGTKRMDQLKVGDEVLVATLDAIECYQPVECFFHQNENVQASFVTIVTQSNVTLSLTPNHLIPFVPCFPKQIPPMHLMDYINYNSVFAQKAKPGLCLAKKVGEHFESDIIISVTFEKKLGVYSPITTQGTIIVNDIQSSCYSTVEHHFLQHGLHKCLLYFHQLLYLLQNLFPFTHSSLTVQGEVPIVLKFIHEIAKLIVPSLIYA